MPRLAGPLREQSRERHDDGFGCAINSNFAAMVADPEHLLHGAEGTGETVVMSSTKAIESYREQAPTGKAA
jgi:pilus assembly protein CpaD